MPSITELMESMKEDADDIIGKGERLVKTYLEPFDTFDHIRHRARKMVRDGEMTREEAIEWIAKKDDEEIADSIRRTDAMLIKEPPERTSFPDMGHQTAHGYKETDGSITPPAEKHLTEWNEHD